MAPHSSTLAWKIPWTEEPARLQSMGSLRVGHDWATSFHFSLSCTGEGNSNPLQCSCLENPRDGGAWWAAVYGVAQSWIRLKRLSSSSSIQMKGQILRRWTTERREKRLCAAHKWSCQSWRKSALNSHWKDWWWSWSSRTLSTWCKELTHRKRPWFWERLKTKGEWVAEDEMIR